MIKNAKMIELLVDEDKELEGVHAMGIVDYPAIESNFVAFSSGKMKRFAEQNKEQQILLGAAMIPNLPIYRVDEEGNEYYNFYTADTVKKCMQIFFKNGYQNNTTLNHEFGIRGVTIFESWQVDDPETDKSKLYGINVPKGTWMISAKVHNQTLWNEFIKTGVLKGFSIEGFFSNTFTENSTDKDVERFKSFIRLVTRMAYVQKKKRL